MMKIEYRFAMVSDVERLVQLRTLMQLEANSFKPEDVTSEFTERVKNYFLTAIPLKKYNCSVALFNDKIIGTAGVCFYQKPPTLAGGSGLVGYVTNVFVEKEFRKKGIGSQLMKELNKLAFELKADKLHLGATSDGLGIYKAVGYKEPRFMSLEMRSPFEIAEVLDRKPDADVSIVEQAHGFSDKVALQKYNKKANEKLDFIIRKALPSEGKYLTDLAARSKAYWPYDKEYLRQAELVTQVTEKDISSWCFKVIEVNQKIIGFYGLIPLKSEDMLDHLWVEPEYIGRGFGKALFADAILSAEKMNWSKIVIAADPYAEQFYIKHGAIKIGTRESKVKPGFFLPLLEYHLDIKIKAEDKSQK